MARKPRTGAEPAKKAKVEFGVDRLPPEERVSPAWPTAEAIEGKRSRAYQRFLTPHPAPIGAYERNIRTPEQRDASHRSWAKGVRKTAEYRQALADGRLKLRDEQEVVPPSD